MQRKRHQPLSIPSEEEEDSDTAMEPDHDERESLLPQQCNNNSNSFLHKEPVDRFRVVYGIFLFLGVATLLPWNFFITAKHYFDFKFRNLTLPDGVPYDTGNVTTDLQTNFESYLSISSMLSNLVFITIAMLLVRHISLNCRMLVSLVPIIIIFIVTVVFVRIDTDSWQHGFFWFTLVSAAFMVGLTAVLTGSVFGLSCLFPPMYTQAVMSGQALGGTLSAVVMIVAIAIGGTPRNSAFWFFLTATVCSALAMGAYFALYRMKYSRFFMSNQDDVDKDVYEVNVEIPHSRELQSKTTYFTSILRKIWPYFMSVSLVFFVTLACFPAIVSLIKSSHYKPGDPWTATYFTPVVCFFIFNICDFIGRSATSWIKLPRNGQGGWLIFCALLRIGFLPLFMMCNIHPDKRKYLPVELADDVWPIVLNIALGLSNGYIGTLSMLYGPNNVELDQAEGAGMVMTFGMTLGLASGSVISLLLISLI
ncbi:equilibrative nucleoside transporter 3-like isoform X2 [Littorina saxatilis]|uniref:equilibrative nucleoside transporter 3-like isoform X2 n=1 Tax=Littorina saxatilis TaxID=31220 RepID=UPI0038B54F8E